MTVIIAGALFVFAGMMIAVMDDLLHHWPSSFFQRWAKGDPLSWWGDAYQVWKRRYIDNDPNQPKKYWFATSLRAFFAVPFNDAWHLAKLLMMMALGAAIGVLTGSLLLAIVFFFLFSVAFTITYKLL